MKKLFVSYSNCQGGAVLHFLKKTWLNDIYEFHQHNNWQFCLGEQQVQPLLEDLPKADVFLYQPTQSFVTGAGVIVPSTEELCMLADSRTKLLSFAYQFNHGFFPLVRHGEWWTGRDVHEAAMRAGRGPFEIQQLLQRYNASAHDNGLDRSSGLYFDCARRFVECAAEQAQRESNVDIEMVPFILKNYRKHRLFLIENHPTSFLLLGIAVRIVAEIAIRAPQKTELDVLAATHAMMTQDENEANLPCGRYPTHPAAKRELALEYPADDNAHEFYREWLQQYVKDMRSK